jgi:hypothetical protein
MDHGARSHRRFAASASERWSECFACVPASDAVPSVPSGPWALDGTEAHELLEYCFLHTLRNATRGYEACIGTGVNWLHRKDTKEERCASVQACLDYVWEIVDAYSPHVQVYLELSFPFPNTHGEDAGGTADVVIYIPGLQLLYVIDFKHGAGKMVKAQGNKQTFMYGKGVKQQLEREGKPVQTMALVIVQPRVYGYDQPQVWVPTSAEEDALWAELDTAIGRGKVPNTDYKVGDWCEWCPVAAARACPALEKRVASVILPTFNTLSDVTTLEALPTRLEMSPARIAEALSLWPVIKTWFEDMESYALELALSGTPIPGKKPVFAQARRTWEPRPQQIAEQLSMLTGRPADEFMVHKLIGITEAEKIIKDAFPVKRGQKSELRDEAFRQFAHMTTKETSGTYTLVDETDRRPAVTPSTMFGKVSVPPAIAIEKETE